MAKVSDIVGEISVASQEQSRGIEQINSAVAEMDKVVQQAAANAEESSSAAEELSSQAHDLSTMVSRFQLSGVRRQATQTLTPHVSKEKAAESGNGGFASYNNQDAAFAEF